MRNIFVFLGALLLVDGVFGVNDTLTVMEGDSVTLNPDTEIPEGVSALWWFGDKIIAKMNKVTGLFSLSEDVDVRFNGRLELDNQTGSLTITNTRTKDTGFYKLQIRGRTVTLKIFSVTVSGVFVDDVNLSVMEGDSVTLNLPTVIPEDDSAQWWFGDKIIARMNKAAGRFSTFEDVDVRFKGRLNLDHQTGSLTITKTRTDHTGLYKLQIRGRTVTLKIFSVTVSDEKKTVSVKEGETITLDTGLVETQGYDRILWKFKDDLIAEINNRTNQFLPHDTSDKRFKGRLQRHPQSVSLIISDSRSNDTGDYHLNMISSSYTVQRNISVTVSVSDKQTPDPGLSSGAVAGIVVGLLLLLLFAAAAGVIYHRHKISKLQRRRDDAEENGTDVSLKDGQQ